MGTIIHTYEARASISFSKAPEATPRYTRAKMILISFDSIMLKKMKIRKQWI